MRLFSTLCLEITSQCNRHCAWCPVGYNSRDDERMDACLLTKALEELGALHYKGRIEFYIYNEPCRDFEWLLQCLHQARTTVPHSCLMIATNGDYLRGPARIHELFQAGLNQMLINCYSPGLYEKRLPWLQGLSQNHSVYVRLGPQQRTVQMLDKSNPAEFGSGVFRLINRAGNIPQFLPALRQPVERMCVKPFRLLNINWRGQALICCNDYHAAHSYGSLEEHTLTQLWRHPVMNTYRRRLYKKDRRSPLCAQCDCHAGAYSHMVQKPEGPYADVPIVG